VDWIVYWFMLPACIGIASVAMFSGISGAALLIPLFLIGFPLLDVPQLTTVAAVGTALLLETPPARTRPRPHQALPRHRTPTRTRTPLKPQTAEPTTIGFGRPGCLETSHVGVAVLWFRTSRTGVSRHAGLMSREIPD
jgi:hypothetical protein